MNNEHDKSNEEKNFVEFRRKVRSAEVLSAAMEQILKDIQSGKFAKNWVAR